MTCRVRSRSNARLGQAQRSSRLGNEKGGFPQQPRSGCPHRREVQVAGERWGGPSAGLMAGAAPAVFRSGRDARGRIPAGGSQEFHQHGFDAAFKAPLLRASARSPGTQLDARGDLPALREHPPVDAALICSNTATRAGHPEDNRRDRRRGIPGRRFAGSQNSLVSVLRSNIAFASAGNKASFRPVERHGRHPVAGIFERRAVRLQ